MQKGHGHVDYVMVKEGLVDASIEGEGISSAAPQGHDVTAPISAPAESKPKLRFGRMFEDARLAPFQPDDQALVALGQVMLNSPDLGDNLSLPAGYTYLAQFVAHDMSFDQNINIPDDKISLDKVVQLRSPSLDLDSVYGAGPKSQSRLYKSETKLWVGKTLCSTVGDADREYWNDLPRENPDNPKEAVIADPRNDDNLAVSQTHVAFLRFHNKVVDHLSMDGLTGEALFEQARKKVIQHYQWIVVNDLLPRIIDETILKKAIENKNNPKYFILTQGKEPFMPVEFSLAAFRLGHSMVRDTYEWNRVFQSSNRSATKMAELADLFRQTGMRGRLSKEQKLPSSWIIDWTRFYDFTGHNGIANNPKFNWSKKIDSTLAPALNEFEGFLRHITEEKFRSLAVLDLIRGKYLGLPTGQDVAKILGLHPLQPRDLSRGLHGDLLRYYDFDEKTPLWYYILKEAEICTGGNRLGPVGSYIVAETIVELIRTSRTSILKEQNWQPDLGQIESNKFAMADLLILANVVNPLGS